jgi:hypothetical protein
VDGGVAELEHLSDLAQGYLYSCFFEKRFLFSTFYFLLMATGLSSSWLKEADVSLNFSFF